MTPLSTLAFDDTVFTVVDRDGQPWLRGPEIAQALGYADSDAISRIYRRNADEFAADMTQTVKLPDLGGQFDRPGRKADLHPQSAGAGQMREVRIFSLRGAYLLGMFASTPPAKRFRRWVLDVLEGKAQSTRAAQAAPQQGDLFGACAQQQLFDEVALLRQLCTTQARLVQLQEEQLRGRKRAKPQPLTVDEIKLARSLKAQGVSQAGIARHMGRSPATISLILRDLH